MHVPTYKEVPPLGRIELGYHQFMRGRETAQSANADWRKLTRMIEWQNQEDERERRETEENKARLRDHLRFMFSSSLLAGKIREDVAQRARERGLAVSHVGN